MKKKQKKEDVKGKKYRYWQWPRYSRSDSITLADKPRTVVTHFLPLLPFPSFPKSTWGTVCYICSDACIDVDVQAKHWPISGGESEECSSATASCSDCTGRLLMSCLLGIISDTCIRQMKGSACTSPLDRYGLACRMHISLICISLWEMLSK